MSKKRKTKLQYDLDYIDLMLTQVYRTKQSVHIYYRTS